MTTGDYAVHGGRTKDLGTPDPGLRRSWRLVTILLALAFFGEAVLAGATLSGFGWARVAHRATAALLVLLTLLASLVCFFTARRRPNGTKLAAILFALAVAAFLQAAVGALSAKGANLFWLHVPLGVALVGFAGQAAALAGRLGRDRQP